MSDPITKEDYDAKLNDLEEICPSGNGAGDWSINSVGGPENSLERLLFLENEQNCMNSGEG